MKMNGVSELFGINVSFLSQQDKKSVENQSCPYTKKECSKMRKSYPQEKIGVCSVKYRSKDVVICPNRFLEDNTIFKDCVPLLSKTQIDDEIFVIPEVVLPEGQIDFILSLTNKKTIENFVGVEVQSVDTTGSVWDERQKLLIEHGLIKKTSPLVGKTYGLNWKMTVKTILVQMLHKCRIFEKLNKHLVLVIQKSLFNYMLENFNLTDINIDDKNGFIHLHIYDLVNENNSLKLTLFAKKRTNSATIERCIPPSNNKKSDLSSIKKILESRVNKANTSFLL